MHGMYSLDIISLVLFVPAGTPACREVELLDLIRALREVTGWMQLGILLRVPKPALDKIYSQCHTQGEDMCKIEMLSTWLNSRTEVPTWDEVVSAVSEMGNKRVASRIASKYGKIYVAIVSIIITLITERFRVM